jgi:integrase
MAEVVKRVWRSGPRRVKRVAWGYTLQVNGKQIRVTNAKWTEEDAEKQLAARVLERDAPTPAAAEPLTFGQAAARYLTAKARKRSLGDDARYLDAFKVTFGAETPLTEITGARISAWREARLAAINPRTKRAYSAAAVNRPLATLRHLLTLAREEWEVLGAVPRVRLEKEPQGRLRWLTKDEAARLLAACDASKNPLLGAIVRLALSTGMRREEILALTWERVDFARGVLRLEVTKSGRRREIPMDDTAYAALSSVRGSREGLVFARADGRRWGKIRTAFESGVEVAKVEDFRFHDLRHTFASWAVQRGASLHELKDLLGHSSLAMVMRYAHLAPENLRQAVNKAGGVLAEVLRGETANAVANGPGFNTTSAQSAKIDGGRRVSP